MISDAAVTQLRSLGMSLVVDKRSLQMIVKREGKERVERQRQLDWHRLRQVRLGRNTCQGTRGMRIFSPASTGVAWPKRSPQ